VQPFLSWLWSFPPLLWPEEPGLLIHWGHFIEATIGLNVLSSIYRVFFQVNISWMDHYKSRKRAWVTQRCDNCDDLDDLLDGSAKAHERGVTRLKNVFSVFAFLMAIFGVMVLYVSAGHPTLTLSQWLQVWIAIWLFLPIPAVFAVGICFQATSRVSTNFRLRSYYAEAFARWASKQFSLVATAADALSGRLTKMASRRRNTAQTQPPPAVPPSDQAQEEAEPKTPMSNGT
jgi:hypothetical protein